MDGEGERVGVGASEGRELELVRELELEFLGTVKEMVPIRNRDQKCIVKGPDYESEP